MAVILIWMAVPKPFRVTSFVSGDNSVLTPFWMTVISLFSFPEVTLIFAVRSVFSENSPTSILRVSFAFVAVHQVSAGSAVNVQLFSLVETMILSFPPKAENCSVSGVTVNSALISMGSSSLSLQELKLSPKLIKSTSIVMNFFFIMIKLNG